ncbi:MAG: efflux RND transporter periplasmic adaptor subunit [Chloracidobacterium sp.]|uniref:Efflux RND transporter periplasmic adaptor subunit n=1 Tax=Chloracidobacterium validum TaxID=2821543 RepID=A0ABX8B958_9BACT|nr:efflux RND transporter periplasmic adaptor subunit [Chloracidobacterium validum]QUW03196.1 efflux RND transporter periplasmic adaptor subunit [Chloracidobacterium validum]
MTVEAKPDVLPAQNEVELVVPPPSVAPRGVGGRKAWAVTVGILVVIAAAGGLWLRARRSTDVASPPATSTPPAAVTKAVVELASLDDIALEPVRQEALTTSLQVTGTVELNPQTIVTVTPLVSGRVKQVLVQQGTRVRAGQPVAVLDSPEIAELHVRLHDAETRRDIAARQVQRVEREESRVALVQSRTRLNQTEAAFERLKQLFEAGVISRQELQDAEAAYAAAKAEYDFQRVVGLERDLREARAALETATVEVKHLSEQLAALGGKASPTDDTVHPAGEIQLVAPLAGLVTERTINVGAFVPAGTALLTVADLRTVWVMAAVPEAQLGQIRIGQAVTVRAPALGEQTLRGQVAFVEAQVNADTRTARVRIEVPNPGERLRSGMFVEVAFLSSTPTPQLVVPVAAVQRIGAHTVVFVAGDNPHQFTVREVELGDAQGESVLVRSGLTLGERVVVKGGLALKTQLAGLAAEGD